MMGHSTVDPAWAARQTLRFVDKRWETPAAPYAEMYRTVLEIEGMDLRVRHRREKAHRYLGWMQGAAEASYGVPAETLRDVNRGVWPPRWPGYELDAAGWYSRPLLDGEERCVTLHLGFTSDDTLYVLTPSADPGRPAPTRGEFDLVDLTRRVTAMVTRLNKEQT